MGSATIVNMPSESVAEGESSFVKVLYPQFSE